MMGLPESPKMSKAMFYSSICHMLTGKPLSFDDWKSYMRVVNSNLNEGALNIAAMIHDFDVFYETSSEQELEILYALGFKLDTLMLSGEDHNIILSYKGNALLSVLAEAVADTMSEMCLSCDMSAIEYTKRGFLLSHGDNHVNVIMQDVTDADIMDAAFIATIDYRGNKDDAFIERVRGLGKSIWVI